MNNYAFIPITETWRVGNALEIDFALVRYRDFREKRQAHREDCHVHVKDIFRASLHNHSTFDNLRDYVAVCHQELLLGCTSAFLEPGNLAFYL